jgi:Tfp pilus assembly protein PilW
MEVMIAMVISSFLVMASLKIFLLFENLIELKNRQMDNSKVAMQFYKVLSFDVNRAVIVEARDNEISVVCPDKKIIRYVFEQTCAIRTVDYLPDTFKIEINDFKISKEGATDYVNEIEMEIKKGSEVHPVNIRKEFPNDLLLNKTICE